MEDLTQFAESLKKYDWGRSGAPLLAIDAEIRKLLHHPDHLAKLEEALLSVLRSEATIAAKRGVCKRLGLIAGERSVPALSALLTDRETSDMARYALERISAGTVASALREALPKTRGRMRIGIINSIGNLKDSGAIPALGNLLLDSDAATAQAAAWALGRIGGVEAIRLLAAHKNATPVGARREVLDAYLLCAERLASEGNKDEARAMYSELNTSSMPAPVRRAAARGLASVGD